MDDSATAEKPIQPENTFKQLKLLISISSIIKTTKGIKTIAY